MSCIHTACVYHYTTHTFDTLLIGLTNLIDVVTMISAFNDLLFLVRVTSDCDKVLKEWCHEVFTAEVWC